MHPVIWLDRRALLLMHEVSIREFGGLRGVRDAGLIDSALARPQNMLAYKSDVTLAELAAAYTFGLARNHPFLDGNKRAAFVALGLFLPPNGWALQVSPVEAFRTMVSVATGETTEPQLADWIAEHITPINAPSNPPR